MSQRRLFQSEAAAAVQAQLYCTSLLVQVTFKEPDVTTTPLKPPREQPFLKYKKTLQFSNVSSAGGGD